MNTFGSESTLKLGSDSFRYYSLEALEKAGVGGVSQLPFSLKVMLENLLRHEDNESVSADDIRAVVNSVGNSTDREIAFRPARILMQDFTGVPAVIDLATMRDVVRQMGGKPSQVNPLQPVDLVIDHSVQVDRFGTPGAFAYNAQMEAERNRERYLFLKWGQTAFKNFRVVPPDTGIVHQVNIEYLAHVVFLNRDGTPTLYPDTLVGTDSHTTMVNGMGVVGWGVGGIEAEGAMLGCPISMLIPEVVGFRMTGRLPEGATATDAVLHVVQTLRKKGVVGKFVEFYGPGLGNLSLADRATISNMAPEYGATIGFFPIDRETIDYMKLTGRSPDAIARTEAYAKAQGMFRDPDSPEPVFGDSLQLDLASVEPSISGPKRPQDRIPLSQSKASFAKALASIAGNASKPEPVQITNGDDSFEIEHGSVVIAAITSCTNTSNPSVMVAAGLLARNAVERGIDVQPWVKTSLAPGSRVVTDYLKDIGLLKHLEALRFHLVGYGCTTCIGNSGPLPEPIAAGVTDNDLVVTSVLSGNRNFEGRINPLVKANYSGIAAAGSGLRAGRQHGHRLRERTARPRRGRHGGLSEGNLARSEGSPGHDPELHQARNVQDGIRRIAGGRRTLEQPRGSNRRTLCMGRRIDIRQETAVLRRHGRWRFRTRKHSRRTGPGHPWRFGDNRPYFSGGRHSDG